MGGDGDFTNAADPADASGVDSSPPQEQAVVFFLGEKSCRHQERSARIRQIRVIRVPPFELGWSHAESDFVVLNLTE